ncbi:ty3-gypsy retrotransposon protein [Tanacetum coccineum]
MDEKTIRGWMKEQQDRAEQIAQQQQQQAATFQAQFKSLRAELQASLGQLQGRPEDQRLRIVGFNLEGAAAEWFRWMSRNGLITDWERFKESVMNHFGPSKYEDPQGELSKLLQLGTIEEYQGEFEKLMNRVTNIPETSLISFYISGLKLHLQRELLVATPTTLGDAFSLARVTEARLDDQATLVSVTATKAVTGSGGQRQPNTRIGVSSNQGTVAKPTLIPPPIQTQTPINTNPKPPLAIKWISPAERQERLNKDDTVQDLKEDVVESGDIFILNSLIGGQRSPRSLQLWGNIGSVDLYVLPMKGPDEVLGIQWLQKLGKVTHDYAQQTMEFSLANTTYSLKGDESLRMKQISLHHMQALLEADEVYGVYEVYSFSMVTEGITTSSEMTESISPEIEQLLVRFSSLFQVPTTLPPHRTIDHRIHLLPNTKLVNVRPYSYPHYQNGEMEKLIKEMMKQGIIRFSQSSFSSPVLLVKKKDGSYRFCVDFRALNEVTIKDKFPIPTTNEMFDELGGANIFTKLDLRAGYHQIRVYERDVYKTAFRTHDGHYEFLVMPFGLTNAPSTFQATMNRLFSPYLRKLVIVFFDDILIYSATLTAHLEHLQCVFQCLQEHQFYVKKSKCVFGATTLEYLGHIITGKGVKMDPKKVAAIMEWPVPTTQRQIRGFLGLAGYYRRFIKNFATVAAPLSRLLQKQGFQWGDTENKAFQDLKARLSEAPILGLPSFEDMFIVEADASDVGIGAVLMQNGKPLSYFSRKLGPRMRLVATYQKELFAIVEAVYKWRQYLLGRRFTIRTDHRSLKELMQQYKTGTTNVVADALSCVYDEADEVIAAFMALSQPLVSLVDALRKENETLDELKIIHQNLERKEVLDGFRQEQGMILFRHSGVKKMLVGMSALFYWKGMGKSIEDFIRKCLVCQQTKYSTQAPTGLLQPLPTPLRVWEDVSMDFVTGLPVYKGLSVILVAVDRFTKYAHFGPLPAAFNAPKVAEVFMDMVVKHHGIRPSCRIEIPFFLVNSGSNCSSYGIGSSSTLGRVWTLSTPIIPYPSGSTKVAVVEELLIERDALLRQLKQILAQAKNQMVMQANRKRREVEYKVGDMVLVKLQPYRQITLAKRCSNKLAKRYYGPFEVLERIGKVAYRLALPEASKIHPVFHVSLLKIFSGTGHGVVTKLPEEEYEGHPVEQPLTICDSRVVLHQGRPTRQVLVQWTGSSPEEATWEYLSEFQEAYPSYHLEDKVISEGEKNVTPRRSKRVRFKPAWQKYYAM